MYKFIALLILSLIFSSCQTKLEFSNKFQGGEFKFSAFECDDVDNLNKEKSNVKIDKYNFNYIGKGICLFYFLEYKIEGDASIISDTLIININYSSKFKDEYKDQTMEKHDCICQNEINVKFEKEIPENIPYDIRFNQTQ
jgi:hypothetical protein